MEKLPLLKKWIGFFKPLFIVIIGGFFTACSIQNQRAEIFKPLDAQLSIKEAFLAKDFVSADWISEQWWEMFNDPQLNVFIERAINNSPTMQSAIETVSLAHDVAKQNFSPLLPSVNAEFKEALFGFNWKRDDIKLKNPLLPDNLLPSWLNFLGYTLNFKWSLDIWGKQAKLFKAAVDDMKGQMAESAFQKLILSVHVAKSYISLQYYTRLKELQLAVLKTQKDTLFIQKQMFCYALADEIDLQKINKSLSQTQINLLETENTLSQLKHELCRLMGENPDVFTSFNEPTAQFNFSFPFPENISLDLLARRPDLVTKIWAIQAATKRVNSAKVEFLPSINLASLSGYLNLKFKDILEPKGWFTSIIPGAALPLFNGFNLRTKLKYSLRKYNLAVYEYNELLLQAMQEVVDSITAFRIANMKLEEQTMVLQADEKILDLSGMRFEYGLNTYLQVLESEMICLEDEMVYVQLLQMRLLSVLSLIKAIGGGYNNPSAQIDMESDFIYE